MRYRNLFKILFLIIISVKSGFGQSNPLDSLYTINAENKSIYVVLQNLSNQSGLYFTYNSDILYEDSTITIQFEKKSLKEILKQLFPDSIYSFHRVDKHVIISEKSETVDSINNIDINPFLYINGTVQDKLTKRGLQFATVSVYNREIGTITNTDGSFALKIPWKYRNDSIAVSFVGYETILIPIPSLQENDNVFSLKRQYIAIQEIVIRNVQPLSLLRMSKEKVRDNYSMDPVILNAFYREAIKKSNNYVLYSEALIDINKSSYLGSYLNDQVKLKKSRKVVDYVNLDTVLLKLKAGVNSALMLDFIKYPISFYTPDHFMKYFYRIVDITNYNKKLVYVVEFDQFYYINEPLYEGKIYIDVHTLAIIGAEFSINQDRIEKAADLFVVKKTRKMDVRPVYAKYKVEYKEFNGKYYLNYVRGDLKLKVRNNEKLFATTFETFIELAVSNIDTTNTQRFRSKDLLRTSDIFEDNISSYDTEFWEDYNFIPPEESIEDAIERIQAKLKDEH